MPVVALGVKTRSVGGALRSWLLLELAHVVAIEKFGGKKELGERLKEEREGRGENKRGEGRKRSYF
jgi:hypothetical protein